MKPRHWLGVAVAAAGIALAKLWLSSGAPEEPAPGPAVSLDQLYPAEAERALQMKAQQSRP